MTPTIAGRALQCNTFSTLGLPVSGTALKIVNKEGDQVGAGEIGEIWVKGEQVFKGYYSNAEENARSFSDDGFFKTGDLGKLTLKGELIITGRSKKEIIVLASGENIDPSRIESTISMLPAHYHRCGFLSGTPKKGLAHSSCLILKSKSMLLSISIKLFITSSK